MKMRNSIFSLLQPLDQMDSRVFYSRCISLFLLVWWSWYLIGYDYQNGEIFDSFMHSILLPIHEGGHFLFLPLGTFFMSLGGSLFQLALPVGIGIAFVVVNRDNFGAGIGLWFTSASLLDLSPYMYDALHPKLILLGGYTGEDGPHDWIYLFTTFEQLHNAQHWGVFVHGLGSVLMCISLFWAAIILRKQYNEYT